MQQKQVQILGVMKAYYTGPPTQTIQGRCDFLGPLSVSGPWSRLSFTAPVASSALAAPPLTRTVH